MEVFKVLSLDFKIIESNFSLYSNIKGNLENFNFNSSSSLSFLIIDNNISLLPLSNFLFSETVLNPFITILSRFCSSIRAFQFFPSEIRDKSC